MGGYGTAFDLVSSEYGWGDEYILELPLVRLRQITAAIQRRRYLKTREENSRFSWLGRNLASFIAAGYMTEGENPALEKARTIAFDDIEAAALGDSTAPGENKEGSFERLMKAFGSDLTNRG